VIDDARRLNPGVPLVLLGHSLGGLVAASLVARGVRPVDGLVLSSPGLDPGLSGFQKALLAVLPRIAPNLRVGNGLDDNFLSHDRPWCRPTATIRSRTTASAAGSRASSPTKAPRCSRRRRAGPCPRC
jgi:alpha-beta hydrolase superfamily lysophospholipase